MRPFQWKNCHADVTAARHDLVVRAFLNDVILPTVNKLEERIAEYRESDDHLAAFYERDLEDTLSETKKAFALSIQSIWERQLRTYLRGCSVELRPGEGVEENVEKADWPKLLRLFRELREIKLQEFPSFERLDTLHHVGNACRHGDGRSARILAERNSEWWPVYDPSFASLVGSPQKTVAEMNVPTECLEQFVQAIVEFWDDTRYIYEESIEKKHASLEAKLARERPERRWRPPAL